MESRIELVLKITVTLIIEVLCFLSVNLGSRISSAQ